MIDQRRRDWIDAINSGDVDRWAELVTEDVVWMPPHGEAIVGRLALKAWLSPFLDAYEYEFAVDGISIRESERWIAESGAFESRMTPSAGGASAAHKGRYFILWRHEDDVWRIERYIDLGSMREP